MSQTNLTIDNLNAQTSRTGFTKHSVAYKLIKRAITLNNPVIRPVYRQGSGKWTSYADHTRSVESALTRMGVSYAKDNNSPKGGKLGTTITIK